MSIVNDRSVEVIRHAAVKSEDGRIFFGKCHGDCFHKAHMLGVKLSSKSGDQGFVTNCDRYLTRQEAAKLALSNGQLDSPTTLLFSEYLWHEEYQGKHTHDEIEGYKLRVSPPQAGIPQEGK